MSGKCELMIVLFFMLSQKPVGCLLRVNLKKEVKIYGKSKKSIQRTDDERSGQLRKKDSANAEDLGVMAAGAGLQYWGFDSGQV